MKVISSNKTKEVAGGCFHAITPAQWIKALVNRAIDPHSLRRFNLNETNIMLPMHIKK